MQKMQWGQMEEHPAQPGEEFVWLGGFQEEVVQKLSIGQTKVR